MGICPFGSIMKLMGKKPAKHPTWMEMAGQEKVVVDVGHDSNLIKQMKMISLTEEEIRFAKAVRKVVEKNIDLIVSTFYQTVLDVEQLRKIIETNSTVERLKRTLQGHLLEMFSGRIDSKFLLKRTRVAEVHVRLGVEPKWYIGAFQNLQDVLIDVVCEQLPDVRDQRKAVATITKLLTFEQQLVLEAYEKENLLQQERRYEDAKNDLKGKIITISEELASLTLETNSSVDSLVVSSQQVKASVQQTSTQSRATQQLATDGQEKLHALITRMQTIESSIAEMEQTVQNLSVSAKQIQNVVKLVQDIANQTSLLALNSSIEAARAGVHGRGFQVVAQEVQKLSDQTKSSAQQIAELATRSNEYTTEVFDSLKQVKSMVDCGQEEFAHTSASFDSIVHSMEGSLLEVQRIESQIRDLVAVIEDIGSASSKVAASAETLNEAAKEA